MVRLRKDLQKEGERKASEMRAVRAIEGASSVRSLMRELAGGDVPNELADVAPAEEGEVRRMAAMFHQKMESLPDLKGRSWYSLFKQFGDEGSGRVSYNEVTRQ